MSRNLTTTTINAVYSQYTNAAFILLLKISFYDKTNDHWDCIFICNNSVDIPSTALDDINHTYIAFPLDVVIPVDGMDNMGKARLVITNITQELVDLIRSVERPMQIDFAVINSQEKDIAVAKWLKYTWRNLTYDVNVITGDLAIENMTTEPYPGDRFTPAITPGLFR